MPRLKPLALGDSTRLRKGAFLIALGNSFNAAHDGNASASWGILSNISRRLEFEADEPISSRKTIGLINFPTLLQLDSKLNLGMSGGAVINLKGELVGLTTMGSNPAGFDAMAGYAIDILSDEKRLREMGKVARWEAQSRFCSSKIIPEYEKFYDRVLERAA